MAARRGRKTTGRSKSRGRASKRGTRSRRSNSSRENPSAERGNQGSTSSEGSSRRYSPNAVLEESGADADTKLNENTALGSQPEDENEEEQGDGE